MFIPKILLGQSTNEINYVKFVTGTWVLTGVFLSNNYQGNNIDQLTSPLQLKKYETFDEILENNLTVYSLPIRYEILQGDITSSDVDFLGPQEFFNDRILDWTINDVKFGKMYFHRKIQHSGEGKRPVLEPIIKIPTNFLEMKNLLQLIYYVETISKCGQEAFVDTLPFVDKLRSKMQVDKSQISQSKTAFGQMYQLWFFERFQYPAEEYARRRFWLIESGLVYIWNEWKYRVESWNDTVQAAKQVSSPAKPLSMNGNLVVVFYVDLSLKSVCLVVFACECAKYAKKFLSRAAVFMLVGLKVLRLVFWECLKAMFQRR